MSDATDMLPSQVVLVGANLLVGVFGRAERDQAAAVIVRVCQVHGDRWQGVTSTLMRDTLEADMQNQVEPFFRLLTNPVFRPNPRELVDRGFAERHGDFLDAPIALTEKGLAAIRASRWFTGDR